MHLRLRHLMAAVLSWRCVPRIGDEGRQVEMNRATLGSRPLRTWLGGTAAAERTPSPEEDEGDGGDDDRERDRGRDVVACVVARPEPDDVVSVRENELLRARRSDRAEGAAVHADFIPSDAR